MSVSRDQELRIKAAQAFMGALAAAIVCIDDFPPENRTTAMFLRYLDSIIADLPNIPGRSELQIPIQELRTILASDMENARHYRALLKNPN